MHLDHSDVFKAELRETVGLSIPSLVKLFEHKHRDVVVAAISLIEKLAEHGRW
jgi:hypothetical protein